MGDTMRHCFIAIAALAAACTSDSGPATYAGAQLELGSYHLELGTAHHGEPVLGMFLVRNTGDLPLGIDSIALGSADGSEKGHEGAFEIEWSVEDIVAPADALPVEQQPGLEVVLAPGAHVPVQISFAPTRVGDNYDAIVVTTEEGPEQGPFELRAHRDHTQRVTMAYLHGTGADDGFGVASIPATVDLGHVFPGQASSATAVLENLGTGDLVLEDVDLVDCSSGFLLEEAPAPGAIIASGASVDFGLRYVSPSADAALCLVALELHDGLAPVQRETSFVANTGASCPDTPPTVEILSPNPTELHTGSGPLEIEIRVWDPDQPLSTMACRVGSMLRVNATVATCVPTDGSGHFFVEVPMDPYAVAGWGTEVFEVEVEDACGLDGRDSVPVRLNADFPADDDDGDAVGASGVHLDCDDDDPLTYPGAVEVADSKDNDCDWIVDEGTVRYDDDGDQFSEEEGDCDDTQPSVYPGAGEVPDGRDQDCDGLVDEGTPQADDDHDGFSTVEADCDDDDPLVHPAAMEICGNWIDDNCNGLRDEEEPCVDQDVDPMIIGGILFSHDGVEPGETVEASVWVYDPDGDAYEMEWDVGVGGWDSLSPDRISWTAPAWSDATDWSIHTVSFQVRVTDARGGQDWALGDVWAWPEGGLESAVTDDAEPIKTGCATGPWGGIWALGLAAFGLRRRRRV